MVAFFNKKEDVIDLQLTGYGKYLLSQGVFKPAYYAFFDDDILYDSECAGFTEIQNATAGRIKEDTPSLRPIPNIIGAETRVNTFINNVSSSLNLVNDLQTTDPNIAFAFDAQQPYEEKVDFLYASLGNSALSSDKAPAWNVTVLHNEINSSSATTLSSNGVIQNIPQINIEVDYKIFFSDGPPDAATVSPLISDTLYLSADADYLVLDIFEENTDYLKDNFDIEIIYSGSLALGTGSAVAENIPMSFMEEGTEALPSAITSPVMTPNVEFYMDVFVDNELPSGIAKSLNIKNVGLAAGRLRLNRDLYASDDDEECC